jgi:nicotinate-nucleotide adenylyltransferase
MQGNVANAADRLELINLSITADSGLSASDVELKRSGPSYTIDTVSYFKQTFPTDSMIYLVMGLDAFLELDTWKSYQELLAQVPFIVIGRPNAEQQGIAAVRKHLDDYLRSSISAQYKYYVDQSCYRLPGKQPIYLFDVTSMDISSTKIRALIKNGQSAQYLVPEKVLEYMKKKGLYL